MELLAQFWRPPPRVEHLTAPTRRRRPPTRSPRFSILLCVVTIAATLAGVALSPGAAEAASGPFAYVPNTGTDTVTPIDTATNTAGTPITVGRHPNGIAITPDGATAYVASGDSNTVTPIDTATNTPGTPFTAGDGVYDIAITPDGSTAYVSNEIGGTVTPIDTATNTAGTPITVGSDPTGIAITPDGTTAYVANSGSGTVTPIDIATDTAGTPIAVGDAPDAGIAITPDGATVYVANAGSGNVTPIDTATNTAGTPITVGSDPLGIAITPDGATAYVANGASDTVTPIDTANNTAGTPITVGNGPDGIAITPDGSTAYVANGGNGTVTPIDIATDTAGSPITVGENPYANIAITPDQPSEAQLSVTPAPVGSPTSFDASASIAPSSPIVSYAWNFGDGDTDTTSSPTTSHIYSTSGNFTATVTETDSAGTSTTQVFTGQTMSLNGGPQAVASQSFVIVACSPNTACSGTVADPAQSSTVSGTSSTEATLSVSLGELSVSCGSGAPESEQVTSYSTTTFSASTLDASLTIDNDSTTNGFKVCYASSTPFVDKQGNSVTSGDLPSCDAVDNVAPCIVSITASDGDLEVELSVLSGDPRMWGAPVMSSFSPTQAAVGAKVTIKGGPFSGTSDVEFDGTPTQFKVNASGTKITTVVPAGAKSGPITVVAADGAVKSSKRFKVT